MHVHKCAASVESILRDDLCALWSSNAVLNVVTWRHDAYYSQVKDHEKLLSFKEQGEQKIALLSQEVNRLKETRIQLHKKFAREARGHREKQTELQKEISDLRKADMMGKRTIRDLERRLEQTSRAEHVTRRRAQIAAERQKTEKENRDLQLAGSGGRAGRDKSGDVVSWFRELVQRR